MSDKPGSAHENPNKRWSSVWIIPFVTLLIGGFLLYYHKSQQGPLVILMTENAEGIKAGKTVIKNRNIDVGVVESTELTDDLKHVEIKVRMHTGMQKLLNGNSAFWVVRPEIGFEGITGLSTLFSGAYIALQPGSPGPAPERYRLSDAPPQASPNAKGIRITLNSPEAGQLMPGYPVLFRGLRVGSVESSQFDMEKRVMRYQVFIASPFDQLVTSNVRFWKNSGIAVDLSSSGMRVEMGSITTLLSGGVSFDLPEGVALDQPVKGVATYTLYDDLRSIANSRYTEHLDFVMFFSDSVRGLQAGAPVEFRGIRLGTVAQVPFNSPEITQDFRSHYQVPVLIHIEPQRFMSGMREDFDLEKKLQLGKKQGLRGSLKTGSLLSGSLFIDLDYYANVKPDKGPDIVAGYKVIPTTPGGLNQIQQKIVAIVDKMNSLPLRPLISVATGTLKQSQRTMTELQKSLRHIDEFISSPAMKTLPEDMQQSLQQLSRSIKGIQPGSPVYQKLTGNMQRLDLVLRELQPLLKTLDNKSNALIIQDAATDDPIPVGAKKTNEK